MSTNNYIVNYKLEFSQSSGGMSWDVIRRALKFMDILLIKHVQKGLHKQQQVGGQAASLLQEVKVLTVKSRVQELCNVDDIFSRDIYCAYLEATISTSEPFQHSSTNRGPVYSARDFIGFVLTSAIRSYIQNQEYPVFVESLSLHYQGPQWCHTNQLAILLTGSLSREMEPTQEVAFASAVADFFADTTGSSSSMPLRETQLAISHQSLATADGPIEPGNEELDSELEVRMVLFHQHSPEWVDSDASLDHASAFLDTLLSLFNDHADLFLRNHLVGSDAFFLNIHACKARALESSPTLAPTRHPTTPTSAPRLDIDSLYKETGGSLKFNSVTVLVVLIPFLILTLGTFIIRRASKEKREKEEADIAQQQRAACTE